jgi:hypothetical protein
MADDKLDDDGAAQQALARMLKAEGKIEEIERALGRAHDELRDLRQILAGGNPVGEAMRFYAASWSQLHGGETYQWERPKANAQMKQLLKQLSLDDLKARMIAYLSDAEPFLTRNAHPFGLFVTRVNSYSPKAQPPPVGCRHDPPCSSDVQHTQRRLHEARS